MMKCHVCQVSMNSSGQYQQHLSGKLHAKKLRQQMSGGQPEPYQKGQPIVSGASKKEKGQEAPIKFVPAGHTQLQPSQPAMQPGQPALQAAQPCFQQPSAVQPNPAAQGCNTGTKATGAQQQTQTHSLPSEPLVFGDSNGIVSVNLDNNDPLYCQICFLKLNSAEQAEFHYRGARHIKKAKVARMQEIGALKESAEKTDHGNFFCAFCNITVNSSQQMEVHRDGAKHKKMVELRKRFSSDQVESQPVAKKASLDITSNIPAVDPSEILPFDQMFPVTTASST